MGMNRTPFLKRLWSRIDVNGPIPEHRPDLGPCWMWMGQTSRGYGRISPGGAATNGAAALFVHRIVYELKRHYLFDDVELDHLCRVPRCCNPDHLEPVSHRENVRRGLARPPATPKKTHCPSGHAYDAENTYVSPRGARKCRECNRRRKSRFETRQRRFGPNRKTIHG